MSWLNNDTPQQQGSKQWHEWRKRHIGASEVSAILGESDFQSPFDLWLVKTGQKEPFKGNWATQRGTDAEPEIRRLYEELHNMTLTAPVMEFKDWPVLSASLDGYNAEFELVVEIKYPSAAKHQEAVLGRVPKTYQAQLQAQLLVSGAKAAHYVSYDGKDIAVVVVEPDRLMQARILDECKQFWEYVETKTPPPGGRATIEPSETLETLAEEFKRLTKIEDETAERMKMVRARISELVDEDKASFCGLELTRSFRKGSVDYGKIPQLKGVDLEPFRKSDIQVTTIKIKGEKNGEVQAG